MTKLLLSFALVLLVFPSYAANYQVNYAESEISFSGTHAGNAFTGVFEEWEAEIVFAPDNLAESTLTATFKPGSAKTGNAMYDGTLPQADWFDIKNHEKAVFESTSISVGEDGGYRAQGALTIRGITQPIGFDFTVSDLSADPVNATGTMKIDRLAFDIGKKSDAGAEWVSQNIDVTLNIVASKD